MRYTRDQVTVLHALRDARRVLARAIEEERGGLAVMQLLKRDRALVENCDDSTLLLLLSRFISPAESVCPLVMAVRLDRFNLIQPLLQRGADTERKWQGTSALQLLTDPWSAHANSQARLEALSHFPAVTFRKPFLFWNLLRTHKEERDLSIAQVFVDAKADVNAVVGTWSMARIAMVKNNTRMLQLLVHAGAKLFPLPAAELSNVDPIILCEAYKSHLLNLQAHLGDVLSVGFGALIPLIREYVTLTCRDCDC